MPREAQREGGRAGPGPGVRPSPVCYHCAYRHRQAEGCGTSAPLQPPCTVSGGLEGPAVAVLWRPGLGRRAAGTPGRGAGALGECTVFSYRIFGAILHDLWSGMTWDGGFLCHLKPGDQGPASRGSQRPRVVPSLQTTLTERPLCAASEIPRCGRNTRTGRQVLAAMAMSCPRCPRRCSSRIPGAAVGPSVLEEPWKWPQGCLLGAPSWPATLGDRGQAGMATSRLCGARNSFLCLDWLVMRAGSQGGELRLQWEPESPPESPEARGEEAWPRRSWLCPYQGPSLGNQRGLYGPSTSQILDSN